MERNRVKQYSNKWKIEKNIEEEEEFRERERETPVAQLPKFHLGNMHLLIVLYEKMWERERERERERECVCVYVLDRERESKREGEGESL